MKIKLPQKETWIYVEKPTRCKEMEKTVGEQISSILIKVYYQMLSLTS